MLVVALVLVLLLNLLLLLLLLLLPLLLLLLMMTCLILMLLLLLMLVLLLVPCLILVLLPIFLFVPNLNLCGCSRLLRRKRIPVAFTTQSRITKIGLFLKHPSAVLVYLSVSVTRNNFNASARTNTKARTQVAYLCRVHKEQRHAQDEHRQIHQRQQHRQKSPLPGALARAVQLVHDPDEHRQHQLVRRRLRAIVVQRRRKRHARRNKDHVSQADHDPEKELGARARRDKRQHPGKHQLAKHLHDLVVVVLGLVRPVQTAKHDLRLLQGQARRQTQRSPHVERGRAIQRHGQSVRQQRRNAHDVHGDGKPRHGARDDVLALPTLDAKVRAQIVAPSDNLAMEHLQRVRSQRRIHDQHDKHHGVDRVGPAGVSKRIQSPEISDAFDQTKKTHLILRRCASVAPRPLPTTYIARTMVKIITGREAK